MKFLSFVDLHESSRAFGELKKLAQKEKPAYLICAGDYSIFEHHAKDMLKKLSSLGKMFIIHGNHEGESSTRELSEQFPNIVFFHQSIVQYKNYVLIGWGGGGFAKRDQEFEVWSRKNAKKILQLKKQGNKIIFVTHAPFYKTELDSMDGAHLGCRSFYEFILAVQPHIGICGHFHENAGKIDQVKNCFVINPGPTGFILDI